MCTMTPRLHAEGSDVVASLARAIATSLSSNGADSRSDGSRTRECACSSGSATVEIRAGGAGAGSVESVPVCFAGGPQECLAMRSFLACLAGARLVGWVAWEATHFPRCNTGANLTSPPGKCLEQIRQ